MIGLIVIGCIVGLVAAAEGIRCWKTPGVPSGDPYYHNVDRADPYLSAGLYTGGIVGAGFGGDCGGGGGDCGGGGGSC